MRKVLYCVLLLATVSCKSQEVVPQPADSVKEFFTKLIDIVEQNSINRRKIDWVSYKQQVWAKVGSAKTVPETEAAMTLAMALLKDNHSSIIVDGRRALYGGIGCGDVPTLPASLSLPTSTIGYVEVKGFSGTSVEGNLLAQSIQNTIARQDNAQLKGWVVDLRRNTGGNMYPMIAGLGPLIGEGVCGYFYDVDNKQTGVYQYVSGQAKYNDQVFSWVERPYQLITPTTKIAVLISNATASSGEATVIALIGKSNVRLFGSASCGLTTGNTQYSLPFYGYSLNLFTVNIADRRRTIYESSIKPDESTEPTNVVQRAVDWITQ